ncbi:MAG: hypothetical protein ABGW77_01460 [Campylobacterales bacterium]
MEERDLIRLELESLYSQLEKALYRKGKEREVNRLFTQILDKSFKILNQKIEKGEKLNPGDPLDLLLLRTMHDYLLELWGQGELEEAKEVAMDLISLIEDQILREMFTIFGLGLVAKIPLHRWIGEYWLPEDGEVYNSYFFPSFSKRVEGLVDRYFEQLVAQFKGE